MKFGAEPKKVAILGVLLAVAGIVLYFNVFQSDSSSTPAPRVATPVAAVTPPTAASAPAPAAQGGLPLPPEAASRRREQKNSSVSEFKPRQGWLRPEDKPDPATIDPVLRLDLLAKVQSVELESASRNVFQYGSAAPPAKPIDLPKNPPTIPINRPPPTAPPPVAAGPPPAPQAPPMTFKYYGFKVSKKDGRKEAFLLDGDDIIIAGENDIMKRGRYKVVRIGVNSIVIEDTQFKSTQTLPLQEGPAAA